MKNSDLWDAYKSYTDQASQVARQIGFAAAGLLWAIKGPEGWTGNVRTGLLFVVSYFVVDLLQYVAASILWRIWVRAKEVGHWEEHGTIDGSYDIPWWLDWPAFIMWCIKLLLLLIAFGVVVAKVL